MKDLEKADAQGIAMSCNTDILDLEVWLRYCPDVRGYT
jgi:hypothetical protein